MNGLAGYAGNVVNPSLIAAIESTRQALLGSGSVNSVWPAGTLPGPNSAGLPDDVPQNLLHWQADSRFTVLAFEALAGMNFNLTGNAGTLRVLLGTSESPTGIELVNIWRPGHDVLVQQAGAVVAQSSDRLLPKSSDIGSRDRLTEIAAQVTPPFAFFCAALPMHPERMRRTFELMELSLVLANFAVQRFKHALAVPRPFHLNPMVFPAILTPAHASLPSGHATEAFILANVLGSLLEGRWTLDEQITPIRKTLLALAARIADNRQVAGLHFPIDTLAGRLLGTTLSHYLVALCTGGDVVSGVFNGADLKVTNGRANLEINGKDFIGPDSAGSNLMLKSDTTSKLSSNGLNITANKTLSWLWKEARNEWGLPEKLGGESLPPPPPNAPSAPSAP